MFGGLTFLTGIAVIPMIIFSTWRTNKKADEIIEEIKTIELEAVEIKNRKRS